MHYPIDGYPADVDSIVSDKGFRKNDFIETKNPICVVTARVPIAESSRCAFLNFTMSINAVQMQAMLNLRLFRSGTWRLSIRLTWLTKQLQLIYRISTWLTLFHLNKYNKTAINYNRDVESFPILKLILTRIFDKNVNLPMYNSPY